MFIISPQLHVVFSPQLNQEPSSGNGSKIANYPTSTGRTTVTAVDSGYVIVTCIQWNLFYLRNSEIRAPFYSRPYQLPPMPIAQKQ